MPHRHFAFKIAELACVRNLSSLRVIDVPMHDGTPFTSRDVLGSIAVIERRILGSDESKGQRKEVAKIECDSGQSVTCLLQGRREREVHPTSE